MNRYGYDNDDRRYPPRRPQSSAGDGLLEMVLDFVLDFLGFLAQVAGRFWMELAPLALAGLTWYGLSLDYGRVPAGIAVGAVAVGFVAWPLPRRLVGGVYHRRSVRRRVRTAFRVIDLPAFRGVPPLLKKVRRVPAGDALRVILPAGAHAGDVEHLADALAATLRVRDVRVSRDRADAGAVTLTIVRRDPWARDLGAWPRAGARSVSLWEPIPVGVNDHGEPVTVTLPERNVLLGGEPGGGKSAALSLLVASAALDPDVRLWLLDGKLVELAGWHGCAERAVGPNIEEANALLAELQAEMDRRYVTLLARRRRKVERGDGLPLHVLVCDELAFYLTATDRKARAEFTDRMRDLVARGRAAGVIVLAATQKPSSDVIPTSLRDLFGFRWALRCSTPQASDTILGSGWASAGYTASEIDPTARGVGWLLAEGGVPVLLRSYWLDDQTCERIAAHAEAGRIVHARLGGRDGLSV